MGKIVLLLLLLPFLHRHLPHPSSLTTPTAPRIIAVEVAFHSRNHLLLVTLPPSISHRVNDAIVVVGFVFVVITVVDVVIIHFVAVVVAFIRPLDAFTFATAATAILSIDFVDAVVVVVVVVVVVAIRERWGKS